MFAMELSVLMGLAAVFGGYSLVRSIRAVLPQVVGLRQALAQCPRQRELRFTIREVIVRYDDGKVVPLRRRKPVSPAARPAVRAA